MIRRQWSKLCRTEIKSKKSDG